MLWLLALGALGVLLVVLGHAGQRTRRCANRRVPGLLFPAAGLGWALGLAAGVTLIGSEMALVAFLLVWLVAGGVVLVMFLATLENSGPASILHVPVTVRYWRCDLRVPKVVRPRQSAEIEIGLTEHDLDLALMPRPEGMTAERLAAVIAQRGIALPLAAFEEEALVAGGGLLPTSSVAVRVWAPGCEVQPPAQTVSISDLVRRPARVLLRPFETGERKILVEFVDAAGVVRGRFTAPFRVAGRLSLLLPDWAARGAVILGAVVALASAATLLTTRVIELSGK